MAAGLGLRERAVLRASTYRSLSRAQKLQMPGSLRQLYGRVKNRALRMPRRPLNSSPLFGSIQTFCRVLKRSRLSGLARLYRPSRTAAAGHTACRNYRRSLIFRHEQAGQDPLQGKQHA